MASNTNLNKIVQDSSADAQINSCSPAEEVNSQLEDYYQEQALKARTHDAKKNIKKQNQVIDPYISDRNRK